MFITSEIASALLAIILVSTTSSNLPVFPDADWQQASPESQGVDSVKLNDAMDYLGVSFGGAGVSETVVIRNGYMIWSGSNIDAYHKIWSCTKSFTSTVLGLLIQDGKCSLDTRAVEYVPTLDDQYPEYSKITLRHLATMTSGYSAVGRGYGDERWNIPAAPLAEAGAKYQYNDNAMNMFGYILTRIAGEPIKDVFKRRIADPIGLTRWDWGDWGEMDGLIVNDPAGYRVGINITARQMARFGYLFLNRGNWNGKQLIDADWVDQATTNQVPVSLSSANYDGRGRYGFNWWTNGIMADGKRIWQSAPPKAFAARGKCNNRCVVIPEWNMVVVRLEPPNEQSVPGYEKIWGAFFDKLADSLASEDYR